MRFEKLDRSPKKTNFKEYVKSKGWPERACICYFWLFIVFSLTFFDRTLYFLYFIFVMPTQTWTHHGEHHLEFVNSKWSFTGYQESDCIMCMLYCMRVYMLWSKYPFIWYPIPQINFSFFKRPTVKWHLILMMVQLS